MAGNMVVSFSFFPLTRSFFAGRRVYHCSIPYAGAVDGINMDFMPLFAGEKSRVFEHILCNIVRIVRYGGHPICAETEIGCFLV